jgi:hypothetical protein
MSYLKETEKPLIEASNTSLKFDQCAHLWILSTGDQYHMWQNLGPLLDQGGKEVKDGK